MVPHGRAEIVRGDPCQPRILCFAAPGVALTESDVVLIAQVTVELDQVYLSVAARSHQEQARWPQTLRMLGVQQNLLNGLHVGGGTALARAKKAAAALRFASSMQMSAIDPRRDLLRDALAALEKYGVYLDSMPIPPVSDESLNAVLEKLDLIIREIEATSGQRFAIGSNFEVRASNYVLVNVYWGPAFRAL